MLLKTITRPSENDTKRQRASASQFVSASVCLFVSPSLLLIAVALAALSGCKSDNTKMGFPPPAPKELALPPKYTPRPVDPALVEAANKQLTASLESKDPWSRVHAVEALADAYEDQAAPHVMRALEDELPMVVTAAATAAGDLKLEAARKRLVELSNPKFDHLPKLQVAVRYALHRLGDTSRTRDLEQYARYVQGNDSKLVRGATALVLGKLGEPSAKGMLITLRADPEAVVRHQASEALYRLKEEPGRDDLLGLLSSKGPAEQMIGLMGLTVHRDPGVREHVRTGLTSQYPEVQLVAARAISYFPPVVKNGKTFFPYDAGYSIVLDGAKSPEPMQRQLAALAIGDIGRTDMQDALRGLLNDKEETVRIAAAVAALQLSRSTRPADPAT